ncbi:MAG TPA: SDR family oxidoreductase [Nitrococcus sp.]|nr:SDR family oxidoreductase [Nitrococcus sp.]
MSADSHERVLIAGCGKIGTRLGEELASLGDEVWGLRRGRIQLPAPLRTLTADLNHPESLRSIPGEITQVFYLATPSAYTDEAYQLTYVEGLRNLLQVLAGQNQAPRRVLFVSSTAVYAQHGGEWVDETSPTAPTGFSGQRLLEAEHLLQQGPFPGLVVRFGGIYGPGRDAMIRKVRAGEPCRAEPPLYTNRIHEDDCIGVLRHLGRLATPDAVYLGVDDAPCTQCELMDWLAEQLGQARPPRASAVTGTPRAGSKRCCNARLKASGYALCFPTYREGYRAMLADSLTGR